MSNIVEKWFGQAFARLHPRLQRLHREGGCLSGPVEIGFGRSLAGVVGRRIARRLGVPATAGRHHLQVTIRSENGVLLWSRCFDDQTAFVSEFKPVGHFPEGYWVERSGALQLLLGVSVIDGGWHWVQRGVRVSGLPLPRFLMPATIAFKEVAGDRYRFSVAISLPLLGPVLSYYGELALASFDTESHSRVAIG